MGATMTEPTRGEFLEQRLRSLDVYRGLIMVTLAFTGFGLAETALHHLLAGGNSAIWGKVHYQFEHTQWVGCSYWDLIQPSFMFMVGVAMAFSYAKREQKGQSYRGMLRHAVMRSLVLIFLGIFLVSNWERSTLWSLMNVLTQIGLGYTFLFLLWRRPFALQLAAAAAILVGTWYLYTLYPYAGIDINKGAPEVGVSKEWAQAHLADVPPAWHKNANVGHAIDVHLLNWFPRTEPFVYNRGGYQTINFIPSLATMLFGLMAGGLLRSGQSASRKLLILVLAGSAGLALGLVLDRYGICPLIKRIWTPSWALFSAGWCFLILASLYALVDVLGWHRWSFPLIVVGVNSIAIYCMGQLLKPWTARTWEIHYAGIRPWIRKAIEPLPASVGENYFGDNLFLALGPLNEPFVKACLVGLAFWLICWYMYRHKIFIRI
jgi:heparan-alpha-glucosaminide N-acetyltransferase